MGEIVTEEGTCNIGGNVFEVTVVDNIQLLGLGVFTTNVF
jgi:hypothetical protein